MLAGFRRTGARTWGTCLLAAATLGLETALTRVFALTQGHHFAFLSISVGMLGMGAGGTLLACLPRVRDGAAVERVLGLSAAGFALTTLASYVVLNAYPFDMYRIAWERVQFLYLAMDYVALAAPFVCSGFGIALALARADQGHVTYAANLAGSAAGSLLALGALDVVGGAGAVAGSAALGSAAALVYLGGGRRSAGRGRGVSRLVASLLCASALALALLRPGWFEVRLSPYRPLSYTLQYPDARVLSSRWSAVSRVDVVASEAIHVSPGLSLGYEGALPLQHGLYEDAHARAPIVAGPEEVVDGWSARLPIALAYQLRPGARALVLEPGGGLDVVVARSQGAREVLAVTTNPLIVDAVRSYGGALYASPATSVVVQSPRAYARARREEQFDVVDVALNDAQRTVVSGAYTLSEDHVYTVEAFSDYLGMLGPDGLLAVQRWLQTPPSESVRAWSLAIASLERSGVAAPQDRLVAIRSWSTMLILVKKSAFSPTELAMVRGFCARNQFDLVYTPDLRAGEVNRYNVYPGAPYAEAFARVLAPTARAAFYRTYAYRVRAPSDDQPYFHHYFRWRQMPDLLQALGHTWQPFGGGGYLVLVALFVLALLVSGAAILAPLALRRRERRERTGGAHGALLAYAGCLGVGYMAIEIPLIQRLSLFLDHPTTAFAIVIAVLLLSSGVGSLFAPRMRARVALPSLVVLVVVLLGTLHALSGWVLALPLALRVAVVCLLLVPVGLLMGVPFPVGLALLRGQASDLVPWAWGINGCTSVVASVLSALLALDLGFSAVLGLGAACYALAWGLLRLAHRREA
ncbi:MAG: hypothetical protein JXA09_02375 [Anaerolineae bacterium]|nr:hypothetical protein [Anaerolineae bacterium]